MAYIYDYDFVNKRVRHYPFLTTFYPLWAGIATKEKPRGSEKNLISVREGGRFADQHLCERQSVGFSVRMGAPPDDRRRRTSPLWISR